MRKEERRNKGFLVLCMGSVSPSHQIGLPVTGAATSSPRRSRRGISLIWREIRLLCLELIQFGLELLHKGWIKVVVHGAGLSPGGEVRLLLATPPAWCTVLCMNWVEGPAFSALVVRDAVGAKHVARIAEWVLAQLGTVTNVNNPNIFGCIVRSHRGTGIIEDKR